MYRDPPDLHPALLAGRVHLNGPGSLGRGDGPREGFQAFFQQADGAGLAAGDLPAEGEKGGGQAAGRCRVPQLLPLVVCSVDRRLDVLGIRCLAALHTHTRRRHPQLAAAGRVFGQAGQVRAYLQPVQGAVGGRSLRA